MKGTSLMDTACSFEHHKSKDTFGYIFPFLPYFAIFNHFCPIATSLNVPELYLFSILVIEKEPCILTRMLRMVCGNAPHYEIKNMKNMKL